MCSSDTSFWNIKQEILSETSEIIRSNFFKWLEEEDTNLRFLIFQRQTPTPLSIHLLHRVVSPIEQAHGDMEIGSTCTRLSRCLRQTADAGHFPASVVPLNLSDVLQR